MTKYSYFYADGSLESDTYYEYGDGVYGIYMSVIKTCYPDGSISESGFTEYSDFTFTREYDADGNLIVNTLYEWTYDEEGNWLTQKYYENDVLLEESTFKIETQEDGWTNFQDTITTYHEDGTKTVCEYDVDGNVISETTYDADGNPV